MNSNLKERKERNNFKREDMTISIMQNVNKNQIKINRKFRHHK